MEILVLFKTHLDVGFTDFAANVVRRYNEQYIPRAIQVGRELLELGVEEVWTGHCTGAPAYELLRPVLGERLHSLSSGAVLEL